MLQESFDAAIEAEFGALQHALRPLGAEALPEDPAEGMEALRALAEEHQDSYPAQLQLGATLRASGELDEALEVLERAAELAPRATGGDSPRALLAGVAIDLGDPDRAMEELEQLLA